MFRDRWQLLLSGLAAGTLVCSMIAIVLGPVVIPIRQVVSLLADGILSVITTGSLPPAAGAGEEQMYAAIIWQLRLPRILLALEIGLALSLAGTVYQGVFRNPLADPYVLGVSSGAALGATVGFSWVVIRNLAGGTLIPLFAFAGALANTFIVYGLARSSGRMPSTTLLLAGVAVSAFSSALVSVILLFADDWLRQIVYWTMGSLATGGWQEVKLLLPFLLLGAGIILAAARPLDLFLLGEERAETTGLSVERAKFLLLTAGALLAAAAVAAGGVIGFAGLIVPHAARLLVGPEHRKLIPVAGLLGALFLLLVDTAARLVVAPRELPIGVITSFAGAPFFLWLLRQAGRHDLRASRLLPVSDRMGRDLAAGEELPSVPGPQISADSGQPSLKSGPSSPPLLEAVEMQVELAGRRILSDISLTLHRGELVGIVGPNGAGKSTLLRALAGLLAPAGGECVLEGRPLRQYSRRMLARRLAFVPQQPDFRFELTVREVVALGRFPHQSFWGGESKADREAVCWALEETGLLALAERPVTALSGGEQQRVALAQALAQQPSVLLLDEPTAHLDLNHQAELMALLDRLRRGGKLGVGVLIVLHDLNLASTWCDRLFLIADGSILRTGTPEEVLEPAILTRVYGIPVQVASSPQTGRPLVSIDWHRWQIHPHSA
ncbi:MAG: heme ABC transporter ATP-binding protein [Limnochordales bacterium]|nr:heme ABC transporter ATP-binding protein [Limnochordales bacterium]